MGCSQHYVSEGYSIIPLTTERSEIVPQTIGFCQSMGWFVLHVMQIDSARVILHFSDASMYRKEKVMPPRSLQAPSGQYVESSPKCLAAHMTELHIQTS